MGREVIRVEDIRQGLSKCLAEIQAKIARHQRVQVEEFLIAGELYALAILHLGREHPVTLDFFAIQQRYYRDARASKVSGPE